MVSEGIADFSCGNVAKKAGVSFDVIAGSDNTNRNMDYMIKGAAKIAKDLYGKGLIHGIAGLGGTGNVTVISLVMREFPFGFTKLILSSSAAIPALSAQFFANTDIVMFHPCVELRAMS